MVEPATVVDHDQHGLPLLRRGSADCRDRPPLASRTGRGETAAMESAQRPPRHCSPRPTVNDLPHSELGSQHRERRSQHRRIFGWELPAHAHRGQVPVRVLPRHAGLASRTTPPALAPGAPDKRASRSASSPSLPRTVGRGASRIGRLAASGRRSYANVPIAVPPRSAPRRARAKNPRPGCGYGCAGSGDVGPGGATFPWITPAAIPPPDAVILTSRPAAIE